MWNFLKKHSGKILGVAVAALTVGCLVGTGYLIASVIKGTVLTLETAGVAGGVFLGATVLQGFLPRANSELPRVGSNSLRANVREIENFNQEVEIELENQALSESQLQAAYLANLKIIENLKKELQNEEKQSDNKENCVTSRRNRS